MNVVVTGIGLSTCLGDLTQTWQNLLAGKSGIQMRQPFLELAPRPLGLVDEMPRSLLSLVQLTLKSALKDAGLEIPLFDCGVAIGSSRGCQASWERLAAYISKNPIPDSLPISSWLETLPHQAAIATARYIGSNAPVSAPMAACATGIWAIDRGYELIQQGKCQRAIAGAVEAPITPLTLAGFEKMGALAKTGCYPFDRHREGLVLGEGAALFVLESAELALSRGASIYGEIRGIGLTCDAYHVSAPAEDNRSASLAIKDCLERGNISIAEIDFIHAHGTSTKLNDRREAELLRHLFPLGVPVSSTKGATGHTLGASGAIGTALCLMALKTQQLPPCVGLREPEFDLDLVRVASSTESEKTLCLSFGFGGQNAAIALGKF